MFARLSKIIIPVKYARITPLSKPFSSVNLQNASRRSTLLTFPTLILFNQYICIAPPNDDERK